ncbi:molybdate ABC transporter substrate-binding protein [Paracoccus sp. Z330]|uniref:Molybdate ABC transporter substrate-binding protein n=1 Tax=Paracoccus onchidii TaxID=3017813 RepID=A0ABT4ZF71_9RHOB|nr:molybdate ABC transporter substrate-binding protein [Paracoccus onchidii]MDB6177966.1 molybdate ABC transporter substrate-binding protein [Paracoccus onchidii]
MSPACPAALSCAIFLLASAPQASLAGDDVVVFAAASLKNAMDAVTAEFTAQTGVSVAISYAGSGQLAKQVIAGAPADLFISANESWMDEVERADALLERRDLLGNSLVLIAHDPDATPVELSTDTDLAGMLQGEKLAMALVDSVPAGQYGKAALETLGLWGGVAGSVAQADNVRAALALVSSGEAPLGIVYATDAAAEPQVQVIGRFSAQTHPPITYPMALISDKPDARKLYDTLIDEAAAQQFRQHGFDVLK